MATSVKGATQHNSNTNGAVRHYKAKVETLSVFIFENTFINKAV